MQSICLVLQDVKYVLVYSSNLPIYKKRERKDIWKTPLRYVPKITTGRRLRYVMVEVAFLSIKQIKNE